MSLGDNLDSLFSEPLSSTHSRLCLICATLPLSSARTASPDQGLTMQP